MNVKFILFLNYNVKVHDFQAMEKFFSVPFCMRSVSELQFLPSELAAKNLPAALIPGG